MHRYLQVAILHSNSKSTVPLEETQTVWDKRFIKMDIDDFLSAGWKVASFLISPCISLCLSSLKHTAAMPSLRHTYARKILLRLTSKKLNKLKNRTSFSAPNKVAYAKLDVDLLSAVLKRKPFDSLSRTDHTHIHWIVAWGIKHFLYSCHIIQLREGCMYYLLYFAPMSCMKIWGWRACTQADADAGQSNRTYLTYRKK